MSFIEVVLLDFILIVGEERFGRGLHSRLAWWIIARKKKSKRDAGFYLFKCEMLTEDEVNKSTGWNNGFGCFFSHIAAENKKV